jgi:hypothetical protein
MQTTCRAERASLLRGRRVAPLAAVLFSCCVGAQPAPQVAPKVACETGAPEAGCPSSDPSKPTWADTSYRYVTTQGDSLAQWVDSFFAAPATEAESADSVLRVLGEYEWDEEEGSDQKIRLRGKVDLPRLGRRLSLVLSEDDDERSDVVPDRERKNSDVGLQYRVAERARSRLYLSVGTNASLEFRSSLRYRYDQPFGDRWNLRLTERVYFKEDDGFGTLTRSDLDFVIDEDRIVRWTSDVVYGEETDGAEWGSRLSFFARMNRKEAISTFAALSGQTDPQSWTGAYSLGARYRRNVFRPWVFVEVEPSRVWRKDDPWENRSSAWVVTFRVEFREELGNRRAGRARGAVQAGPP